MGRTPSIIKKDKTVPVKVRIVPAAPPPPTVKPKPPRKPRAITREEWEKACKLFRKRNPLKRNKKELQVWENYGPFLLSDEAQKISKAFTGGKSQKDCFGRWLKKFDNLWSCTHDYPKPGEPTPDFPKVEWQLMAELESCCRAKDGFTCHCGGLFVETAYGTEDPMSRRDIGRKAQSIAAKMDGTDKFVGSDGFAREFKKRMEVIHQNEISSRGKYETIFFRAPIGTKEELNEVIEFTKKHSSERLESYNDPYESKAGQAIPKHLFHSCQLLDEEATMAHLKGKKDERRHIKPPTRAAGRGNKLETPSKIHVLPDGTPAQSLAKFYSLSHLPFLGKVAKICTDVFSHYFDGKRHHDADKNQLMSAFGNVEIHAAPAQEHMALFPKHTDKQAIWFPMVGVFVLQGISFTFVRRHDEETENKSKADFATKEGDRHVYEAWKKNLSEEEQKKVYEYEKTLINSGGGRLVVYYLTAGSLLIFPAGTYEHAVIVPANQARSVALFYNVATPDETFSKEHTGETLSNNLCQLKKP